MKPLLKIRKARKAVVLAAKCVESGFEPDCEVEFDPDDLYDLLVSVRELRALEAG